MPKISKKSIPCLEHLEARQTLNAFLKSFPLYFKKELRKNVRQLVLSLIKKIQPVVTKHKDKNIVQIVVVGDDNGVGSYADLVEKISIEFQRFFDDLINSDEFYELGLTEVDSAVLIRLLEKYLTSLFYDGLFNLVEMSTRETELENAITRYSSIISPEYLKITLKLDNSEVRSCYYLSIRELVKIQSVKSAHEKLDCIHKSSLFIMEGLAKSMDGQSVSADDFLPALIYTVMKAKVPKLLTHLGFISKFIGVQKHLVYGEPAYYFTNLVGACEMIQSGLEMLNSGSIAHHDRDNCPDRFSDSIEIIHKELRSVFESRTAEMVSCLKQNKELMDKLIRDQKEKKVWNVIKWIPGINIGYGSIRGVVYIVKRNKKEAANSVIGTVGGIAGVAAGVGGAFVGGPLVVPIVVSMVAGGAANQTVTGGGELAAESYNNPDWFNSLSHDERETQIYERVIKDIPLLGLGYSAIRAPTYLIKGNKPEAKKCGINAVINGGASAVGVAAGIGIAKLASAALPAASAASKSAADAAEDITKPVATEMLEFLSTQAVKIVSSQSTQTAVRVGACSLTRMVMEEGMIVKDEEIGEDIF